MSAEVLECLAGTVVFYWPSLLWYYLQVLSVQLAKRKLTVLHRGPKGMSMTENESR